METHTMKPTGFDVTYERLTKSDLPYTYADECPITPDNLLKVSFTHYTFDYKLAMGSFVVNKRIADDVLEVMELAFNIKYPLNAMSLDMEAFKGNDELSMIANNSSSFNHRHILGTENLSKHSYGLAIDINPLYNPSFAADNAWHPHNGIYYIDRRTIHAGILTSMHPITRAFYAKGFTWGGDWNRPDFHHFEL